MPLPRTPGRTLLPGHRPQRRDRPVHRVGHPAQPREHLKPRRATSGSGTGRPSCPAYGSVTVPSSRPAPWSPPTSRPTRSSAATRPNRSRCGTEDKLHRARLCTRCTIADRLDELLDDGTGRIRPELLPLADSLLATDRPLSGLAWLDRSKGSPGSTADLLRRLGRGDIELTHEAFHSLQPWRAAAHLRELLMTCGILPAIDKQICSFERWLIGHLADIPDPDHAGHPPVRLRPPPSGIPYGVLVVRVSRRHGRVTNLARNARAAGESSR